MKRIALINPPSPFLTDQRVFPNIGLVRVGTALSEEGHDVDIHDFAGRDPEGIRDIGEYDYYGFSSTSPQMPQTMGLLGRLKDVRPNARTILGGPHASALYPLWKKGPDDPNIGDLGVFDTIFAGEGEETTRMFDPGWQKADLIRDIDQTPIPDREMIDLESYHYEMAGKPTTSVQTQRGCPFVCGFCSGRDVDMYRTVRTHSPGRVLEELDALSARYGYKSFMWYDDEVNANPARLKALCDALAKRPYQHRSFVRSDLVARRPESIGWLKRAGFVKLCTGVESGSDRILTTDNKGTTVAQNYEAREIIGKLGIDYEAFLIIGHPGETPDDVQQTIDWVKAAKPDDFDISILTPYPGSKFYDTAVPSTKFDGYSHEHEGLYFNRPRFAQGASYYKGPNGSSAAVSRTDAMTEKFIKDKRDEIQAMRVRK